MKRFYQELFIGIFLTCFLIVCFSPNTSAENLSYSERNQFENKAISAAISKLITRSNNVENLPDISNKSIRDKVLRDKVLRKAAEKFFSQQSEPLDSDVNFFSDPESPWFQGWYTRITGKDGSSIAVIGATQYLPLVTKEDNYLPGYLAVIVPDIEELDQVKIYEHFPNKTAFWSNRDSVLDDPSSSSWEDFWWCEVEGDQCNENIITNEYITAVVHNEELDDKIEFDATFGPRLPYNSNIQWLGPEGMVEFLPFVPLHWFVYSLGSTAQYNYKIFKGGELLDEVEDATGYAHQESNWGTVFPPAWI